jgi:hypothetical protein
MSLWNWVSFVGGWRGILLGCNSTAFDAPNAVAQRRLPAPLGLEGSSYARKQSTDVSTGEGLLRGRQGTTVVFRTNHDSGLATCAKR